MRTQIKKLLLGTALMSAGAMVATSASATDGYFQNGYGARHKALAGSGVADTRDATAMSLNPAGLVNSGANFTGSVSIFIPDRGFTGAGGPSFTPGGEHRGNDYGVFQIPNFAYSSPINENTSWGISMYGNGGMNTDFETTINPACAFSPTPAADGVFCSGNTGVNLNQAFISVGLAHSYGNLSIGVAPIVAIQSFEAKGLAAFGGVTSDPANLTNNETDYALGGGVRVGIQYNLTDSVRFGAAYQSKIWMGKLGDYAGLFADAGGFDIPSSINVGVAADLSPAVTLMVDYRRIAYEGVGSIGNPTTVPLPFGSPDGPGFGWDNMNVYKVGMEWRASDDWTWRVGYSHNTAVIGPEDVTLNILAPAVVKDHITAGFEKRFGKRHALEMGVMYAPNATVTGIEVTPFGPNPGHTITLDMTQYEVTVGWKMYFDQK